MAAGDRVELSEGWYAIVPAQDTTLGLDVYNGSGSNGANIWLFTANENASQSFWVKKASGGGYNVWCGTNAKKLFDSQGYYKAGQHMKNGTNLAIWDSDGGADQRWYFEESGVDPVIIGDTEFPLYNIVSAQDGGFCLDCCGGTAYVRDNVLLWTMVRKASQCFALVPIVQAATRQLSVPASVMAFEDGKSPATGSSEVIGIDTFSTLRAAWKSPYSDFQARYRVIESDGSAGQWQSCVDGSYSCRGWGATAFRAAKKGDWTYCSVGDGTMVVDGQRVEFEVRPCDCGNTEESKAGDISVATKHYGSAGCSVAVQQVPTVTAEAASWSPLGLSVTVKVSTTAVNCSGTVSVPALGAKESFTGKSGTFQVLLPVSTIPTSGQSVIVSGSLVTGEGLTVPRWSNAVEVSYGDTSGSFDPYTERIYYCAGRVDLTDSATHRAWLLVDGIAHELRDGPDKYTYFPIPQVESTLFSADIIDGTWRTKSTAYPASPTAEFGFVWEGGFETIRENAGGAPDFSWSEDADSSETLTTGRAYQLATVGNGRKVKASVKGIWSGGGYDRRAKALMDARFCWLTTPHGQLWRCAITDVSIDGGNSHYAPVSISLVRVDG